MSEDVAGRCSPGLVLALATILLALVAALVPEGVGVQVPGLGPQLDRVLPHGGRVTHERLRRRADGVEDSVRASASLGVEIAAGVMYLIWIPLAWLALRPWSEFGEDRAALRLWPRADDVPPLLSCLALLASVFLVVGLVAALVAAEQDGGRPLRRAVYGFTLPVLSGSAAIWPVLRFLVLGPLAEELVWRGIVFRGLRRRLGLIPAGVGSALAFALWHLVSGWTEPGALLVQYSFALAAAWLTERTGALAAALALHVIGNACTLLLFVGTMYFPAQVLGVFGVPA